MKKLFVLLVFAVVAIAANAQKGKYITITASEADTNKNAETDYIYFPNVGGFESQTDLMLQILCTDAYGGTSDGTITLEGSVDGVSYAPITDEIFTDVSDDTATIAPAAVLQFNIPVTHHYKYRAKAVGTSGDTTLFTPRYRFQDIKQ